MSERNHVMVVWCVVALLALGFGLPGASPADRVILTVSSDTPQSGQQVTFRVDLPSLRFRPAATDFALDFGDGSPAQLVPNLNSSFVIDHVYTTDGRFTATVTQDGVAAAGVAITVGLQSQPATSPASRPLTVSLPTDAPAEGRDVSADSPPVDSRPVDSRPVDSPSVDSPPASSTSLKDQPSGQETAANATVVGHLATEAHPTSQTSDDVTSHGQQTTPDGSKISSRSSEDASTQLVGAVKRAVTENGAALVSYSAHDDVIVSDPHTGNRLFQPLAARFLAGPAPRTSSPPVTVWGSGRFATDGVHDPRGNDSENNFTMTFGREVAKTTVSYFGGEPLVAIGDSASAPFDRLRFSSLSQLALSKASKASWGYANERVRSSLEQMKSVFGTLNFTLPKSRSVEVGLNRGTRLSSTWNKMTDSAHVAYRALLGAGSYSILAVASNLTDRLSPANSSTERTVAVAYSLSRSDHDLDVNVSARRVSANGGSTTFSQTVGYGFPLRGKLFNGSLIRGLELRFEAERDTTRALYGDSLDRSLSTNLTFHIGQRARLGVRSELSWHKDSSPDYSRRAGVLRLQLDVPR